MEKLIGVDLTQNKVLIDVKDEDGYSICCELDNISYENVLTNDIVTFEENSRDFLYEKNKNENITFITVPEFFKLVVQLNK